MAKKTTPKLTHSTQTPLKILIGVTGSISAYKAADIVSLFKKQGHQVRCLMTENAKEFVTPLVLETLSENPVASRLFAPEISGTEHISLARWPDLFLIAPASANALAKIALGLSDDLLSTVALATRAPLVITPAMNTAMWENPVTQAHVATLRSRGVKFIDPDSGVLACGEDGPGKLAQPERVVAETLAASSSETPQDLAGLRVLITAGPTTSAIDAVRYLTNHSTGKMGAALAEDATCRGAEVFYILGVDKGVVRPTPHPRLHVTEVHTAEEMLKASLKFLPEVDGVIATAAVLDYSVATPASGKLKRGDKSTALNLIPSVDVLKSLREAATQRQWFLGFAAETDDLRAHADDKLRKKNLTYLFANRVAKKGEVLKTGFGTTTNGGLFFSRNRKPIEMAVRAKAELAHEIWNELVRDGILK